MENLFNIWQKQKDFLDKEKEKNPDSFFRKTIIDDNQLLSKIGITVFSADRPAVYLRLWPQDFIVEEISNDNRIHTVDYKFDSLENNLENGTTIYADLVKVGISTFDAVEEISKMGIDKKLIGYAGIKDRDGITSQLICFRNSTIDSIQNIRVPNFFLKNIYQDKGAVQVGDLKGNRFTITVRGNENLHGNEINSLINRHHQEGFWNFYYTQRFGTPRLISHYLGLLILRGEYEDALKVLLTYKTDYEIVFFHNLRDEITTLWRNWQAIINVLENLPYTFRRELEILRYLKDNPSNFSGALKVFSDQAQLWIFAYASYLFNRALSMMIMENKVPETIPLLLSRNPDDWRIYKDLLEADGVKMPSTALRDFPSIQIKSRQVNTRQKFDFHGFKIVPNMPKVAVISFSLPKGSYATTFLAHLFLLSGNIPVLPGISREVIDSKKILGIGNIQPVIDIFKNVIVSKLERGEVETDQI